MVKDLVSPGRIYFRSYGGRQVLVSEGNEGVDIPEPDIEQADVPLDEVVHVGEQLMHRLPAFESAGLVGIAGGAVIGIGGDEGIVGSLNMPPNSVLARAFCHSGIGLFQTNVSPRITSSRMRSRTWVSLSGPSCPNCPI